MWSLAWSVMDDILHDIKAVEDYNYSLFVYLRDWQIFCTLCFFFFFKVLVKNKYKTCILLAVQGFFHCWAQFCSSIILLCSADYSVWITFQALSRVCLQITHVKAISKRVWRSKSWYRTKQQWCQGIWTRLISPTHLCSAEQAMPIHVKWLLICS